MSRDNELRASESEVCELLLRELGDRERRILEKLESVAKKQSDLERKIDKWETSLFVLQWLAGVTAGVVGAVAVAATFIKEHVHL